MYKVKNNLFIKFAVMLFFLVLLVSAMPDEYIDSTLSSIVYSGRKRSERGGHKASIREGAVFDEFDEAVLSQFTNLPVLIGMDINRTVDYIETYGFRQPKGNERKGVEQILVLQAIYPAAQMTELAGPLRELFLREVQQHQAVWGY